MTTGIIVLILRILLLVCLYGFLGWAVYTIWRDLRAQGKFLSDPMFPTLSLTLLDSNEEDKVVEQSFDTAEVVIGRSTVSDYSIVDDTVSARHARLSYHHNQWWIEDLNSTNGTYLNDERISMATVIVSGDELRCGQVNLLMRIVEKGR